jgi:hypothetical protein
MGMLDTILVAPLILEEGVLMIGVGALSMAQLRDRVNVTHIPILLVPIFKLLHLLQNFFVAFLACTITQHFNN